MKPPARERILDTADKLFSSRGYGNVGINEIIDRSGTAKASFYKHFPSKERLCTDWLAARHDKSESEWENVLQKSGQPEKKILEVFDDLKGFMEQSNFRGCPFTNTGGFLGETDGSVREQIVLHKQAQREFFINLASEMTTLARARKLGTALFLLYTGANMESQNAQDTWPVVEAKTTVKDLIRLYLRAS
ncbi:MAG: TetR/AcrR family transcriptional regulator [Oceanipulchritudo sp.]